MHATNERFRIFASYRILFLHTFQCGTRYRGCVTNSTRNIVKSTNVLVREKQQGRGGSSLCRMLRDENANSRRIRACMRVCVLYARASRGYSTNEWYGSKHDLQWFAKHREQPSIKHPEIGYSCPPSRLYVIVVRLDGWMHVWYTVYADRSRTLFYSPRIHKRANKTNTYLDVRVASKDRNLRPPVQSDDLSPLVRSRMIFIMQTEVEHKISIYTTLFRCKK